MKIPTYDEALDRIKAGNATPLDVFVYSNEPVGAIPEAEFRKSLQDAVDYIQANTPLPTSIQEALNSGDGTYRP